MEPQHTPPRPINVPYGRVDSMSDPKDMLASKRFWGLFIIIASRLPMIPLGMQGAIGEVMGDPIMLDTMTTVIAMTALFSFDAIGQWVHKWGKDDAKALLK